MRGYHVVKMILVDIRIADILSNITFRAVLTVFCLLDRATMLLGLVKLNCLIVIGKVSETILLAINQNWGRSRTKQVILTGTIITSATRNSVVATEHVLVMLEKFSDGCTMQPKRESRHGFIEVPPYNMVII